MYAQTISKHQPQPEEIPDSKQVDIFRISKRYHRYILEVNNCTDEMRNDKGVIITDTSTNWDATPLTGIMSMYCIYSTFNIETSATSFYSRPHFCSCDHCQSCNFGDCPFIRVIGAPTTQIIKFKPYIPKSTTNPKVRSDLECLQKKRQKDLDEMVTLENALKVRGLQPI